MQKVKCERSEWVARADATSEESNVYNVLYLANRDLYNGYWELSDLDSGLPGHKKLARDFVYQTQANIIDSMYSYIMILQGYVNDVLQNIEDLDGNMSSKMQGPQYELSHINWESISAPNTVGVTSANGTYFTSITLADLFDRINGGDFDPSSAKSPKEIAKAKLQELQATAEDLAGKIIKGKLDDQDWQTLIDLSDSQYAKLFGALLYNYEGVTPEVVASLAHGLSLAYGTNRDKGYVIDERGALSGDDYLSILAEQYDKKLTALGELLGAATRSEVPPLKDSFKADVLTLLQPNEGSALPAAMSVILSHGTYSKDFALEIAEKVYDFEKGVGSTLWNLLAGGEGMLNPDGTQLTDVMGGVLAMVGSNPDAAQDFFTTTDDNGQLVIDDARMDYLLKDRSWTSPMSDQGDGLGKALEAATTGYRNQEQTGITSAQLATEVLSILGKSEEFADSMPAAMKDSIAAIVAVYMPDVIRVANTLHGSGSDALSDPGYYTGDYTAFGFPEGMPVGALLTQGGLDNIFHSLGRGDDWQDNLKTLLQGWAAADAVVCDNVFQINPSGWMDRSKQDATVMAAIVNNAVDGAVAEQEALKQGDQTKEGLRSQILDLIGDIPIFDVPADATKLGKFLWNIAEDVTKDTVKNTLEQQMLEKGSGATSPVDSGDSIETVFKNDMSGIWMDAMLNYVMSQGSEHPSENVVITQGVQLSPDAITAGLNTQDQYGNYAITIDESGRYHANPNTNAFSDWCGQGDYPWVHVTDEVGSGIVWK